MNNDNKVYTYQVLNDYQLQRADEGKSKDYDSETKACERAKEMAEVHGETCYVAKVLYKVATEKPKYIVKTTEV